MDSHAQAFITAAGISNGTIESAIDNLCIYLKKWGLWDKMIGLYPFVGGSAATHKFNLKDAQDTNSAKRLLFSGGWTHSANGALPNGSTGYADTFIDLAQDVPQYNLHFSYYSRTNVIGSDDYVIMGVGNPPMYIDLYFNNRLFVAVGTSPGNTTVVNPMSGFNGLIIFSSINPQGYKIYRNRNIVGSNSDDRYVYFPFADPSSPKTVYIGAFNSQGTPNYFCNMECAFASIGHGLNEDECQLLNNAVDQFQTTLSRNV